MSASTLSTGTKVWKAIQDVIGFYRADCNVLRKADIHAAAESPCKSRAMLIVSRIAGFQINPIPGNTHKPVSEQIEMAQPAEVVLRAGQVAIIARMFGSQFHVRRPSVSREVHDESQVLVGPRLRRGVPPGESKMLAFRVALGDETPTRI